MGIFGILDTGKYFNKNWGYREIVDSKWEKKKKNEENKQVEQK